MTPDGTPVIGRAGFDNLYLNTGRGTLGWTMACGSGRVLADLVGGNKPEIIAEDLSINRYASAGNRPHLITRVAGVGVEGPSAQRCMAAYCTQC